MRPRLMAINRTLLSACAQLASRCITRIKSGADSQIYFAGLVGDFSLSKSKSLARGLTQTKSFSLRSAQENCISQGLRTRLYLQRLARKR